MTLRKVSQLAGCCSWLLDIMSYMFRGTFSRAVCVAILCGSTLACAQTIQPQREIHLPVPLSRGSYNHWPIPELSAREHYAMRVAPDQSILIFDSDTNGNWPLVRTKRWWTDKPTSEVLDVPGWSAADKKYLNDIYVDVQVTPDGHYAVAFSGAAWQEKSDFLFHAPRDYVARKPDTIITVIDLQNWQIVKSIHAAGIVDGSIRDARVVSDNWMAFDTILSSKLSKDGAYPAVDWSLSIPELDSGPKCTTQRFFHMGRPAPDSIVESVRAQNDAECRELLQITGAKSTDELEARTVRNSDIEPKIMKLRDVSWKEDYLEQESRHPISEVERLWEADFGSTEFFRYWGEYPYNAMDVHNPPFESSSRLWYGLYGAHDNKGLYELARYDARGTEEALKTEDHLLCGDSALGNPKSACGCRVIDVSEAQDTLLTYCRQQHGDFDGIVQRQWLSVLRSDDLSDVGLIPLSKGSETLQAIASGDGQAYVVTLAFGELLRVYAVPVRP